MDQVPATEEEQANEESEVTCEDEAHEADGGRQGGGRQNRVEKWAADGDGVYPRQEPTDRDAAGPAPEAHAEFLHTSPFEIFQCVYCLSVFFFSRHSSVTL